jgi:hypothetical protein
MNIIGFAGKAGTGKNTLADLYVKPLGYKSVALADEIKLRAVACGVATYEEVFGPKKPAHVRTWLQQEGTERGRDVYGEDIWVRALHARLRRVEQEWGLSEFVVTDVRFVNEVRFIQQAGGVVFLIEAPRRNLALELTDEQRNHPSERDLEKLFHREFDGVLYNDPAYVTAVGVQLYARMAELGMLNAYPPIVEIVESAGLVAAS